jgi:hypothetical protein
MAASCRGYITVSNDKLFRALAEVGQDALDEFEIDRSSLEILKQLIAELQEAELQEAAETIAENIADRLQIAVFFDVLFRYAESGFIQLRTFKDKPETGTWGRPWPSVAVGDSNSLITTATNVANKAALAEERVVFAPPVVTFKSADQAKEEHVAEGVALSVECDEHPELARQKLEWLLGPPTLIVNSGGTWTDPETGHVQDRCHLHWRLQEPTRTPDDHIKLKRCRRLACAIAGGDPSAISLVHPLRLAGSWHRKAEPRLTRIVELNPDAEIDVHDALEKLREAAGEAECTERDAPAPRVTSDLRAAELIDVTAAVAVIENDNLEWAEWNQTGMAIFAATAGSAAGLSAWHAFSEKSGKCDQAVTTERWQHYRTSPPDRIGAGTLFHLAKKACPGWQRPSRHARSAKNSAALAAILADARAELTDTDPVDDHGDAGETADRHDQYEEKLAVEPLDLLGSLTPQPVITRDMLPDVIADFAFDAAARIGVDPAMVAIPALVVCAAALDDGIQIQPKVHDTGWTESARLWVTQIGEPGTKKTPAQNAAVRPVRDIERKWRSEDALKLAEYEQEMEEYEKAKRATKDGEDPPQKPEKPPMRRLIVNEMTMEKLADILADNPRGLLLHYDELPAFIGGLDAYRSNGARKDRPAALELWNGGPRSIDRVKGSIFVENWSGCIMGGIQDDKLAKLAPSLSDDGLLQRFLMFRADNKGLGEDRPPDINAITGYNGLVHMLTKLTGDLEPVRLSPGAHRHRLEVARIADALASMPAMPPALRAHARKIDGLFARLLLTMHAIDCSPRSLLPLVSAETAKRARDLMVLFFLPHAMRLYNEFFEGGNEAGEDSKWIAGHILAHGLEWLTERDLYRAKREFKDRTLLSRALKVLVDAGWLTPSNGGWCVNPLVHVRFTERATEEKRQREQIRAQITGHADVLRDTYYRRSPLGGEVGLQDAVSSRHLDTVDTLSVLVGRTNTVAMDAQSLCE